MYGVKSFQRYQRYARRLHVPLMLLPIAISAEALLQFMLSSVVLAGLAYYGLRGQVYSRPAPNSSSFPSGSSSAWPSPGACR